MIMLLVGIIINGSVISRTPLGEGPLEIVILIVAFSIATYYFSHDVREYAKT